MTGRDTVTQRVVALVSTADDEVVYTTAEEALAGEIIESLASASDRGVSIRLAETSQFAEHRFEEGLPDARRVESLWDWSDTPAGRLLVVDRERTLVSVLADGSGEQPPEPRDETAIRGAGPANSLVVVPKALFT